MGWPSCIDSADTIRSDLEHLAGCSSKPAELDIGAARVAIAAAERLLNEIREVLKVACDPSLPVAYEVVRLRALTVVQERQRRVDLERIERLSREAARRALETIDWRDKYLEFSRRNAAARRCRRPARRRG